MTDHVLDPDDLLPLRGLRVLSLADDLLPSLGRWLADLGAGVEVLRRDESAGAGRSPRDLLESRGKRFSPLPIERAAVDERLAAADVVVVSPDAATSAGYSGVREIAAAHPELVVAALSEFGLEGVRAGWTATEAVDQALSGSLSRSGEPGRPPLLPPGEIFRISAAQEIAWSVLGAVYRSFSGATRRGALLDCSIFDAGAVALDPANGITGSGTPDNIDSDDRPDAASIYPIYRVRDGYVRVCVLAKTQWLALLEWMGNPEDLQSEELHTNPGRWAMKHVLVPRQQEFFAQFTCAEMVEQCRQRRIPAAAVLSPADVLSVDHFRLNGVVAEAGSLDGKTVRSAAGMARIDGVRTTRRSAKAPSEGSGWPVSGTGTPGEYPLSGLTVLDLGVIVAGAVAGELFAQLGARVIRVENTRFPDGMRRSFESATPALARGHRGKESVGLDLRSEEGRGIFLDLVRRADVVSSNFKPGTLERLGISYDELRAVNPRIVCVESSAFGDTGPWRTAMGYGPLVRAATGQTWLWRENADSGYFADGITVFPDHLAGRVCASAALACVLNRLRTGEGARVTVAQSDIGLVVMAPVLAAESLSPGSALPPGDVMAHALRDVVLPAAGDDQWCVVDPQTPEQVAALRTVVGNGDDAVAAWVRARSAADAAAQLQAAGVPAGQMVRLREMDDDPALAERELYGSTRVPGTGEELLVERLGVLSDDVEVPKLTPMPMFGAHTRSVLAELGIAPDAVRRLLADGIAQESDAVRDEFDADSAASVRAGRK